MLVHTHLYVHVHTHLYVHIQHDDLLNEVYSKDVCDLFTKGSHHRNISVILITQNLFHQGRFSRYISLKPRIP